MKQDWTEQMRNKLEGHEQTPPEGLWESVSEQMGLTTAPVRRSVIPVRWWWGVAAAIVVAVGVGLYHVSLPAPPEERTMAEVNETSATTLVAKNEPQRPEENEEKEEESTPVRQNLAAKPGTAIHGKAEKAILAKENETEKSEPAKDGEAEKSEAARGTESAPVVTDKALAEAATDIDPATVLPPGGAKKGGLPPVSQDMEETAENRRGHISISMEGSGGLLAAQTLHREGRIYYTTPSGYFGAPSASGIPGASPAPPLYSLTDYASKHHLPVCFGLNLQWHLHPRLALVTGLHYTYMHSEFSIPLYETTLRNQHLHYLGLPLGLSARIWGNRHFQVYATAGAMLEKCLNDEPWQWSVNVAAGAEYLFHRRAGLFVEPSVGYYFDDGTRLQHYYKQHPWAPSIEVGLRVHVGK